MQRGLPDPTLVAWGGEFGRKPLPEMRRPEDAGNAGCDLHPEGFSVWLAGGGVNARAVVGKTGPLGLKIVDDPVHVHDLQPTILHLPGLDHTRLTCLYLGRDFRLTGVSGEIARRLPA
jgi:hypothetical protein